MQNLERVKIVYLGVFPPKKGYSGGDRRMKDFFLGASKSISSVELLIPIWQKEQVDLEETKKYQINFLESPFQQIPVLKRLFFWMKLCQYVVNQRAQMVLFYGPTFDVIPFLIYLKARQICLGQEMSDLVSTSSKGLKNYLYLLNEKWIPKFMDFAIGISNAICDNFLRANKNLEIRKIPILVDLEQFTTSHEKTFNFRERYHLSSDQIIISYVGSTLKEEGLANLIESFKILTQKHAHIILVLAGKYVKNSAEHDDVEHLLAKTSQVILPGMLHTQEIIELYSESDILVVPQLKNPFNTAALPTKLAEYAAMGKATCISNVGDINQYFTDSNSILFEYGKDQILTESLEKLIQDKDLRDRLGMEIRKTAETKFDNQQVGTTLIEIFNQKQA